MGVAGHPASGLATACYTAYLFAQAKARDLWQSPLLPPHLVVQAVLAGAATLLPFAVWLAPAQGVTRARGGCSRSPRHSHLVLVWPRSSLPHATAHARLAAHEMTRGRFARRASAAGVVARGGLRRRAAGSVLVAVPFALVGLLAHEHAYVQAGQSVPLA